ncbi:flagellar biosynthesis protein FliQ [Desulfolucanica intricata]|uniref:flagellar biosynthesis protein FliQ n=1 Tax=Desulfolucanica intricata TaxID=1285191 RepID=UPI00082FBA5B|nr:flagellar biosynthesis protein FliQ [Desulfolucanica intricata]
MTQTFAVHIAREALMMTLILALPPLGIGLLVGLAISVLQATTQIQEQTLTFVPKIIAIFAVLLLLASWMLNMMVDFTEEIFNQLGKVSE